MSRVKDRYQLEIQQRHNAVQPLIPDYQPPVKNQDDTLKHPEPEDMKSIRTWKDLPANTKPDLMPEYMYAEEASKYIRSTKKKLALYRKYGLLKAGKLGKNYVYRKAWLDQFMDSWCGYDLSNEEAVSAALKEKAFRRSHGLDA